MRKLVTRNHKINTAAQINESISENANTLYYFFFGEHGTSVSSNTELIDSTFDTFKDPYRRMIFGKKIKSVDVSYVIKRNMYQTNTIYSAYDDITGNKEGEEIDSSFYCITNEGAYYHVYKCLDNNFNAPSTVQPLFSEIDIEDEVYITSDNYQWKYMYSISSAEVTKFGTNEYFPLNKNLDVESSAASGKIEVIKIENPGKGYNNYCNGVFKISELKLNGNSYIYSLNSSQNASIANNFYDNCFLYITGGTGVGQYEQIINYTTNSTAKAITLRKPLNQNLAGDSSYEITPSIIITGDGTQTINAEGRAIINPVSNTIQKIEMLNLGKDYKEATAYVYSSAIVGVSNVAVLRVITSPKGGHGANAATELGATSLAFSVKLGNTDPKIPLTNEYRTIGILKDPWFDQTTLNFVNSAENFLPLETIYKIKPVRISTNATVTISNNTITANADFQNQLEINSDIYISDGLTNQLMQVNNIVNSTHIIVSTNSYFSCTDTKIYKTNLDICGKVESVSTGSVVLNNVNGEFKINDFIIGKNSGVTANVSLIKRGGEVATFDTFNATNKLIGATLSGTFIENEIIFQSPTGNISDAFVTAKLHSVSGTGPTTEYLVTEQNGIFNLGESMRGKDSFATAILTDKYNAEIHFGSGDILYIEKIDPITRTNSTSETIKFVFKF